MTEETKHMTEELHPLKLKSVQDILDERYSFFVPAYQRGYRWKSYDVELLIKDILQFQEEESKKDADKRCPFYSLQAVVLKDGTDNQLEVIDGQQRLTTILLLLQTIYAISREDVLPTLIEAGNQSKLVDPSLYVIKYETRENSTNWLTTITKAYFDDESDGNNKELAKLQDRNADYYHFVEAFNTAMRIISKLNEDERNAFAKTLRQDTRFIWYNISESSDDVSNNEVDIFNRLNATKISLNNAELIKALFLQDGNFLNILGKDMLYERDQMAIDWDNLENNLQKPSFWYFIYSTKHPYQYETRIEYLFDLIKGKSAEDRDDYYYSFSKYYTGYMLAENDKLRYVRDCWREVHEMYLMLQEWYNDKCCYHYIGYLLEYGKKANGTNIDIPYLQKELAGLKKNEREGKLKAYIKYSLKSVKSHQLVHGRNEMTQVLFLFNIEMELRRQNKTSRFSFAEYKKIKEDIGWDQEHVASHIDYEPKYEKRIELAGDLLEFFTGVKYSKEEQYFDDVRAAFAQEEEAKELCEKLLIFFNEKIDEEAMRQVYDAIMTYFELDDKFVEAIQFGKKKVSEKDFIWNFVLLNSKTNRSYGNHIYPVKRQRIQRDENMIYTPVGTRSVFEKAYSVKLTNMIAWGRNDAIAYWNTIINTLGEFLPKNFALPAYIKI